MEHHNRSERTPICINREIWWLGGVLVRHPATIFPSLRKKVRTKETPSPSPSLSDMLTEGFWFCETCQTVSRAGMDAVATVASGAGPAGSVSKSQCFTWNQRDQTRAMLGITVTDDDGSRRRIG